jgi:Tfp pilus assembly protein PilZ
MSTDEKPGPAVEKRSTPRVQPFVVQCSVSAGDLQHSAYLTELSVDGARVVSTKDPPDAGTPLVLDIRFSRRIDPVRVPAKVVWVEPRSGPRGTAVFGVSFDGISAEDRRLLDTVLGEFRRKAAIFQAAPAGSAEPPTPLRRGWREGPFSEVDSGDWLSLDDDELLFRVEALPDDHDRDETLMTVVESERHFFIRQEAAKKIRDRELLKKHSADRHIGQILARVMARDEDEVYLRKLYAESQHLEVRKAAEAQIRLMESRRGTSKS